MLPPPENTDSGIVQEAERLMGVHLETEEEPCSVGSVNSSIFTLLLCYWMSEPSIGSFNFLHLEFAELCIKQDMLAY
jgi:hypothetical protein